LILEDLIQRGQVKEARAIISKQPDEFLRGVLMLAAAPLAEEAGHPQAAAELNEQGTKIIAEKVSGGVDMGAWYSPETRELVELLRSYKPHVTNLRPIDVAGVGSILENSAPSPGAPHRTRLPFSWQALAHLASARMRFYTQKSLWIGVGLMADVMIYGIVTGQASTFDFPSWLAIPFVSLLAWMFVGQMFFAGVNGALKRLSQRFEAGLRAAAIAIERLPEADRQRRYARLLRFFHRTRTAEMPPLCEPLFAYWTARRFEALRDQPDRIADLVIDSSQMWESTVDTLVYCIASLDASRVRQVYHSVLYRAFASADYGRVLYMLVQSVAATGDVDLLVDCLERYRRLTDDDSKKESAAQKPLLLYSLPRTSLARAVLASMQRPALPAGEWLQERLARLLSNFFLMEGARMVVRSPFELVLAFALIAPYGIFIGTALAVGILLFFVPIIALLLAAGAPRDPYGLVTRCRSMGPADIRRTLARRLLGIDFSWDFWRLGGRMTSAWVLAPAALRYMRQSVIAQNILRNERVEIASSPRAMQRVVSWIIREGLYGPPAEVVLKVMDDRQLLAAARDSAPATTGARRRAPALDDDRYQLMRVLPSRSPILSGMTGIVLGALVTLCWLAVCALLFPGAVKTWLWPHAAAATLAGCVFLVGVQHLYEVLGIERLAPRLIEEGSRQWQRLRLLLRRAPSRIVDADSVSVPAVAVWYQIGMGILSIVVLYRFASAARENALAIGIPYPMDRSDTPFLFGVAAIAILTAKALVPSLVARWRGSRLLYPTLFQLWRERLWILPQLATGAVVLALLAHWQIAGGANVETVSADFYKRGKDSYAKGDFQKSIQPLSEAIRFAPHNTDAHALRCVAYRRSNEPALAAADCEEALRLDRTVRSRMSELLYGYGKAYYDKRDYAKAIAELDEAIAFDPSHVDTLEMRCDAHFERREWPQVIADCGDVVRLDHSKGPAFRKRALAYEVLRDYERAIADFGEVIRLSPADSSAWNGRCWARAISGRLTGALDDCNEALTLNPDNADALDSRGLSYLKMGEFDKAIADYDAVLALRPRAAESLYGRGIAKLRKGDELGGRVDIASAKAIKADIDEEFGGYDVRQ
jgi:tetratricopeptide (TPR) repeat protein